MTHTFYINGEPIQIDTAKTVEFYLAQNKIVDDCQCDDCNFYATTFIKNELEIFSTLNAMGIDLCKNLISEPTGVWCVRGDHGELLHCEQIYQAVGQFTNEMTSKVIYEKTENNFKVFVSVVKMENAIIDFQLIIDKA